MAERVVYSCDWCCVDSPLGGSIADGWSIVDDSAAGYATPGKKCHLCQTCSNTRITAIQEARAERFRATHQQPATPTGSEGEDGGPHG